MSKVDDGDKKGKILIVDETPETWQFLTELLATNGYQVRLATDGRMVFESVVLTPPDLILLGSSISIPDGYEVCQQLKAEESTHPIPLIFIRATPEMFDPVKAFSLGAMDCLTKSFVSAEILARIENSVKIWQLQKRLREQNAQLQLSEIGDRKQTEDFLRLSEATNRAPIDAIPDLLFRCQADGIFVDFQLAKAMKSSVSPSGFFERKLEELLPPQLTEQFMQACEQTWLSGQVQILEYQLAVDGQQRDDEARFVACGSDEAIAMVRDISDVYDKLRLRKQNELCAEKTKKKPDKILTDAELKHSLSQMPTECLAQLYYESCDGSDDAILELLEQLPDPRQESIVDALRELANNFKFKKIID